MEYDYLKKLPVRKRPKMLSLWGKEYYRDWKKLRWFLLFSLPGALSALWNSYILDRWKWALFGFVASQFLIAIGFTFICSGMSSSNWGTYFKETEPLRYWIDLAILLCMYFFVMFGMWIGK